MKECKLLVILTLKRTRFQNEKGMKMRSKVQKRMMMTPICKKSWN